MKSDPRNAALATSATITQSPLNPMLLETEVSPTLGALVRCRQTVLTRANELLDATTDVPFSERFDALPAITGLLMTSLEELKVAEEELREQNTALLAKQAGEN